MTPDVAIRRMRWWDIEPVAALEPLLFDDPWNAAMFWEELAQHETRDYLVAESDGVVVGYAGLAVFPDEGSIQNIAVVPEARRTGLGTRLLVELLRIAKERQRDRVALEVRVDNAAAIALYRRHGFEPVRVRKSYYQPSGVDALVMVRS